MQQKNQMNVQRVVNKKKVVIDSKNVLATVFFIATRPVYVSIGILAIVKNAKKCEWYLKQHKPRKTIRAGVCVQIVTEQLKKEVVH